MPLLDALNAPSAPLDVNFQVAAERFNDHGPKIEYMLTLEAPLKGMTFEPQQDQKTSAIDAALLAVLKDSNGEIFEKFSKDFAVQVALDKVNAYKEGNLVQTFRTELPPGAYALQPDGRIPYIANLPADKFTPGSYEIRIGVTQGSLTAEEKVAFQVD